MQKVCADFNAIAPFETGNWNHNNHYYDFLLDSLPQNNQHILEIGCGIGAFSRLLAERANLVTAIDLSPEMIKRAKSLSKSQTNIDFQIADILESDFPPESFDAIVSIATFHHLPLNEVLPKLKSALKPGGKLMILDVLRMETIKDFLIGAIAVPLSFVLKVFHNGFVRPTREQREAWKNHTKTDCCLSFSEAKQIYPGYFEKASVQRHFFFRYSMIWEKTAL